MGIVNREGALYMATGMDVSGVYKGRREAIGIIKAMASQITSFDVFSGIGISAATAFANAAKSAYDFEKEFQKNMLEVATISTQVEGSMTDFMNRVVAITQQIPVSAPEAAKALYQIVSAGHDGAAGMQILEVSAKSAVGGLTDTATAADAITTLLNAYKLSADKAEQISDQLFTTVRLGKTDFGQLGQSIAQVAPIAASYGVEINQVLAAVASLTKQGTPTAQAMTQIRAAIIGTSKVLGDGAFEGRTFQEALAEVAARANGSESKLRELVPEIEAVNGVLGMTGQNAKAAASDLGELQNSAGATETAFQKMQEDVDNQLKLLGNNVHAALRPFGEAILKEVSSVAQAFNEAFAKGEIPESMRTLGDLIVIVTGALMGYKGSIIAVTAAKTLYKAVTDWIIKAKVVEASRIVLSGQAYAAEAAIIAKNTSARILLTNALKAQAAAALKSAAAMLTNPYTLAAAAIAALGYTLYKYVTQATAAELAQRRFNDTIDQFNKKEDERRQKIEQLINIIQDETETNYAKIRAYEQLKSLSPMLTAAYDLEKLKVLELKDANKKLNEERDKANYDNIIQNVNKYTQAVNSLKNAHDWTAKDITEEIRKQYSGQVVSKAAQEAQKDLNIWKNALNDYNEKVKQAKQAEWEANTPVEEKVKHYQDIQARLEKERDELNLQLNPSKVLRSYAEEMADSWLNAKNTIANIKLDALNKQIDETSQKINSLTGKGEGSMLIVNKNKAYWEKQKKEAETALEAIDSKQKRLMDTGNFKGIDSKIVEKYKEQSKLFKEAEKELKVYDSSSKQENETAKRLKAQQDLSRSILDSELKLQSDRIAIMQDGKDKRVLLADQEYKETLATIQKEREEYQKKINETKGKEDPAVLQTFTNREGLAKNKRDTDVAKITRDYSDQMKAIQNEVDSHFRSQLDNRLIDIDNYYKEQIKKAREAGETEEGDFIQMLINKRDAEKEYARKESVLSGVDFKEQVDLGNLNNSSGAYFVEETERQKTEILKKYALERIAILESLGDEQSRKESELLKIAVEGYNKALSKPSKKSINTLVDEKAIKALQKHFMNLGASEEEAKKKAESFAETFQGKMQTVSEVTGLLKDVFGGISEELDMALDAIGNIAKGFAEGGLIGGISAAAGQLISVVSNLFTAKREIDKSMVEGYEAYMGAINELIDTQVALLDKLGGMAFGQNIIDTTKDIAKSIAASRILFNEAMRAGSGVFSHSDGYKANKMLKGYARELREVGIYTTDLNRMTNEQLAALKKLPEVYARLPEGLRKYIDAIAEGLDKTEEFKEQIQDTVLGLDFTSIADMIVNSITDPSIDNALEEFEANIDKTIASIVQNMLRRNMLLGPLEKMTADLYKSMEKKDKNGNTYYKLTADAARDFKENVLGLGKQFDNAWKELEEAFRASGIDLMPKKEEVETDASDNSLKGAYAKASEESIGLLAGQFGAIRVILEEMKNSMVPIREQMQAIYNMQVKGWEDVRAIRELTNKVEKNTDKITEIAERLEDTVGEISKDTRRSADALDGGTINTKIRM